MMLLRGHVMALLLALATPAPADIVQCTMTGDELMLAAVNGDPEIRDVPWPSVLEVRPWPLLDLAYGIYTDATMEIVLNVEQIEKMPELEACSIVVHEFRHHLQNVLGWNMDDVQREIDARAVQQAFLARHEHELRGGLGLFAVKQWKRAQVAAAHVGGTDLTRYEILHCHAWHDRAVACQMKAPDGR